MVGDDDVGEDNLQVTLDEPKTIKLGEAKAKVGSGKPGASVKQGSQASSATKPAAYKLSTNKKIKKKVIKAEGLPATHLEGGEFNTSNQASPGIEMRGDT